MSPRLRLSHVAALGLVLLAGCGRTGRHHHAVPSPAPVPVSTAKETSLQPHLVISGVIAPFQNVTITSALSEPADAVNVLAGARVHAGEVIAVLDTADLRAQLTQAEGSIQADTQTAESDDAKVAEARYTARLTSSSASNSVPVAASALQQAQHTLQNDEANLARDQNLVARGYLAQQTLEQQQTTVQNDRAAVRGAQANLMTARTGSGINGTSDAGLPASTVADAAASARAARAAIEIARGQAEQYRAQIAKATITSPVDGIVVNRNLNPGEYPGSRTIFTIQQLDPAYADLNASSADTFSIPVGAQAALSVSGMGSRGYTGKVSAVLGQPAPGSTNFTVQVLLRNPDYRLQAGLPVSATIALPRVSGVAIPTTAFLDDSHTSVMTVEDGDGGQVAHQVAVRERTADGTSSIVTGLTAGTRVVSNGQLGLADGQSIAK